MTFVVRAVGRSHTGLVKPNNEDSYHLGPRLLVVADGVGGSVAGEVASEAVTSAFAEVERRADTDPYQVLAEAVELSTVRLNELLAGDPELAGMGTTVTAMSWLDKKVVFAQIGDSRAYYLPRSRNGEPRVLHQVTHDDSFVQYLVDSGSITAEQARHHPQRNVILKALNGKDVPPTFSTYAGLAGDRYLLCSDGLSDPVPGELIAARLALDPAEVPADEVADLLVQDALDAGAPDNVTVVIADLVPSG